MKFNSYGVHSYYRHHSQPRLMSRVKQKLPAESCSVHAQVHIWELRTGVVLIGTSQAFPTNRQLEERIYLL